MRVEPVEKWVEPFAGVAGVGSVLCHGAARKAPIARQGNKTRYSPAILQAMGLRPRQGAKKIILNDLDPDVVNLWQCLTDSDKKRGVAKHLINWISCPIHKTGPAPSTCPHCYGTGRQNTYALWQNLNSLQPKTPIERAARYTALITRSRFGNLKTKAFQARKIAQTDIHSPNNGSGKSYESTVKQILHEWFQGVDIQITSKPFNELFSDEPAIFFLDPPYQKTADYIHNATRSEVIDYANSLNEAGHIVAITEQNPFHEILQGRWYAVNITRAVKRGARGVSRQYNEWLTMNRLPASDPFFEGILTT